MNYGNLAKIYLAFDEPWWTISNEYTLLWKDKDFEIFQKDVSIYVKVAMSNIQNKIHRFKTSCLERKKLATRINWIPAS